MIARIYALLARIKETNDVSISWTRLTRRRTLPSREEMRHWIYLLREDAQPLVYPAPLAPASPLLHGVRAPTPLAPLVGPRLMLCCVAPEACGSPRQDPRLSSFDRRQPPLWRAFFLRFAMRFRPASACRPPKCEYCGDLVGLEFFSECSRSVTSTR